MNAYATKPQQLEDELKEVLEIYEAYAKKMPAHSPHTDGYIDGLKDLVAKDIKKFANYNETQLDTLYNQKRKDIFAKHGMTSYSDGYMQAYNALSKLCLDWGAFEVLNEAQDIKTRFGL